MIFVTTTSTGILLDANHESETAVIPEMGLWIYIFSIYLKLTDTYQNGIFDQNGSLGPVLVFLCIDYIIDSEDGALCA